MVTIDFTNEREITEFQGSVERNSLSREWGNVRFLKRKSLFWYIWKLFFPEADMNKTIIAFMGNVYCPKNMESMTPDLALHELVHIKQQEFQRYKFPVNYILAIAWQLDYLFSKKFRYAFELEAYGIQLVFLKRLNDGSLDKKLVQKVATIMSSPMYGNMVSFNEVYPTLIKALSL